MNNEAQPIDFNFNEEQVSALSSIPVSMSGLNFRVQKALKKYGKNSLYEGILEIKSEFNSIKGIGADSIKESNEVVAQLISRLRTIKPNDAGNLDYRLILFDGLSFNINIRKALENLPLSLIGLNNRAVHTLEKKQITNIYEAIIEIKTSFQSTEGIGKKTIDESIQVIDKLLLKLENIEPHLIESTLEPRKVYFIEAEGDFLSILNEIIDLYFEKYEKNFKKRNKDIMVKRFNLDGQGQYTLDEIGTYYDLTRERVRQIEAKKLNNIELLLSGLLKTKDWCLDKNIIKKYNEFKKVINSKNFIILHSELLELIRAYSQNQFNDLYLPFLMELFGTFRLAKTYTNFRGTIYDSWCRTENFKPSDIEALFRALNVVFESPEPITLFDLTVKVKKKSHKKFSNDIIHLALTVCPEIEFNGDKLYVKFEFLKSATDKAYIVLLENDDKMHHSEILRKINSLSINNKNNPLTKFYLTTQLASDGRFISIGKSGYWGLKKWGTIDNISIVKVMENVLHKISEPINYCHMLKETLKVRPDASEKSIQIYLTSKPEIFTRVDKDQYALTAWNMPSYKSNYTHAKVSNSKFYEKTFQILTNQNPIPLAEFVRQMLPLTDLKEVSIRNRARSSPLLSTRLFNSRNKEVYCENLDKLKNYSDENENLTLKQEIQNRVLDILKREDAPITKGDLYKKLSKNFSCLKPTFYAYLSDMDEIRQFTRNNNSFVEVIDN